MSRPAKDDVREERIEMEIIVDAYHSEERAMGWYYYLEDKLQFPFRARRTIKRRTSPLAESEEVEVLGMAPEEECEEEMFVEIAYKEDTLAVPLAQLEAIDADDDTREAIEDWHYWVAQDYEF